MGMTFVGTRVAKGLPYARIPSAFQLADFDVCLVQIFEFWYHFNRHALPHVVFLIGRP